MRFAVVGSQTYVSDYSFYVIRSVPFCALTSFSYLYVWTYIYHITQSVTMIVPSVYKFKFNFYRRIFGGRLVFQIQSQQWSKFLVTMFFTKWHCIILFTHFLLSITHSVHTFITLFTLFMLCSHFVHSIHTLCCI